MLCCVMGVSRSAYYDWEPKHGEIDSEKWHLTQKMKALFDESNDSLGSRQMMKQLRKEGFTIGHYRTRMLMREEGLIVRRKKRFVVTTDSKHAEPIADNLLNRQFIPTEKNKVWTTDITYLWTMQGWVYLAIVLDLYSRRIVGWSMDEHMETSLVSRALNMAINLRQPGEGVLHHSDRGSQYASKAYRRLLADNGMVCSMSRKGNCWDNAPTERFFSSLKREWVTGKIYPAKESVVNDVNSYMTYYNSRRLHTTIGDLTPMEFEKCA